MAGRTIGALFQNQARGEAALARLKAANFPSAQISEVADDGAASGSSKLSDPSTDFFKDHTSSGSEFRQSLTGLGMSAADADYFEDGVARGGALVTVIAGTRAAEAIEILRDAGGELGGAAGASATGTTPGATLRDTADADRVLQLREERLSVDKVRVASGAVRIRKQIVSEQQAIDVPVSHDELVIERRTVTDGAVGGTIGAGETITVPLTREEVTVGKETFVTEEVEVGKRAVAGTERVDETLRREELVVDDATTTTTDRPLR